MTAAMSASGSVRPKLGIGVDGSNPNLRSLPPSRSSSYLPPTRSSTPGYPASIASSTQLPSQQGETSRSNSHSHSHSGLSKLRHMFDAQKHALFEAHVVIHELGNVPQLQGEFDVQWKFRGRQPKGKELADLRKNGPTTKPSLPNLKLGNVPSNQPSSSSASIRTTSTTSSGAYPPTPRSLLTPPAVRPSKALSLPPPKDNLDRPAKKGSDPTPLKQVLAPDNRLTKVESPEQIVDEPEGFGSDTESQTQSRPHSRDTSSSSRQSTQGSNTLPPTINVRRPSLQVSGPSSRNSSGVATPTERLSVPFPRSVPPIRSGTTPSYSTLVDPLPNTADGGRQALNRTISMATTATSSSTSTSISHRPGMRRIRSASGPGPGTVPHSDVLSDSRKGTTPGRPLRSHTCKFEYELHHVLRIPLGKPAPSVTPTGYPYRPRPPGPDLPVLGGGPQSESSLRLVIEQLPSTGKSSATPATGAKDSLGSTLAAAHHADKKDFNPSEAGNRRENKEKTIFGIVDVDLAVFAGKGVMTRRFLLRGSRTNATIKLSVDMRWIGGEEHWAAPPMQEGHHVAGVGDFMANEATEAMRSDLGLAKTPSNSSEGSSLGLERTRTNFSAVSSIYASPNHSAISLGASLSTHQYQSYEHHLLKPETLKHTPTRGRNGGASGHGTPHAAANGRARSASPAPGYTGSPMKNDRSFASALTPSPLILNLSKVHHHHRHHTHHLRGHGRVKAKSGIYDLPPEVIIEAIFNPHPASVEGPFTYVPQGPGYPELACEKDVLDKVVHDAGVNEDEGDAEPEGDGADSPNHANGNGNGNGKGDGGGGERGKHKLGWRMRGRAKAEKKEKRERRKTDPVE